MEGSVELYSAPDEKARRSHQLSLDNEDFCIDIHSKFSDSNRYIEIRIKYNGTILCPLCNCVDETMIGTSPSSHSSYYHWWRLKDVTLDDWGHACEVISNIYANKHVWFLNEVPVAIEKFERLLENTDVLDLRKLKVCKVFMELIDDCKLNRYKGISLFISRNCKTIQQFAINAINHDTAFDTGKEVMELLYNFMKDSDLLKEFYSHFDFSHE